VIIDQLTAGENLVLTVLGNIAAGQPADGAANVTGGSIRLNAGNVGTQENPLQTDLISRNGNQTGLSTNVNDIFLKSLGDMVIRDLNGKDVHIDANGRVDGAPDNGNASDIHARNLYITANNGVGSSKNPLIIYVPGVIQIASRYASVFFRNVYAISAEDTILRRCSCKSIFWDMVVERIMEAEENETVEILEIVPCSRMPEKVMQALRERDDVTLVLHLDGEKTLVIEAGHALGYKPGVECYDLLWLFKYYMEDNA
jgi:hypothetical protein